jgi:signal transduction histidine kinase
VDDEAGLLKAAKPILEMQGSFHVETALSVEEAMEKMEAKTFDVIVSDYIMPGKDGLEFLRELRESGNNIPFIVFTGKGREIVAINALMAINEKLNVVGRLTRHDVRNKLSVIANNVYLAKQKLAANHSALEYLGDIESAIDQVEKIFGFSRTYEMLGVEELSCIDMKKNVDEAAIMFSELSTVKLVNECKGLTVMADSLLRQLFYNLIDNTLKYGEKVSRIRVYYEEEAEQLKLVYEDNGVGIAEKEKEKIFRDEYGRGTGYGLYLIRKICENYGWTISETGVPGKGAQFTMTLPKINNKRETLHPIS